MKGADKLARVARVYPSVYKVRQSTRVVVEHPYANEILKVFFSTESPVALAVFDAAFRCQTLNARLSALIGQPIEACVEKCVDEVFQNLAPQISTSLQEVKLSGNPILHREISGRRSGAPFQAGDWAASFFPVNDDKDSTVERFVIVISDITSQKQTLEALAQSEAKERRRLARDLHDSVGQYLTALKIKLEANLGRLLLDSRLSKLLADSAALVDQCLRETRTIAYLLHPPLLDQLGLPSALRWYVDGFAERSGINMNLDIPPDFVRLPTDRETALFRVVQESLTNIHRHSGSTTASIRLMSDAENVRLEVTDQGCGVLAGKLQHDVDEKTVFGMGIVGMKERIRQFGGQLTLSTGRQGTTVTATLPVGADE